MLKKAAPITVSLFLVSFLAQSQNFRQQFQDVFSRQDTAGQAKVLTAWEASRPTDPELLIAYFNYYAQNSRTETLSLDSRQQEGESIVVSDTGTGKPVAFLNSSTRYNTEILRKGFDYIDRGITLYPMRLDMRFGKIYILGEAESYEAFTKAIVETIDYGQKINNAWLWKDGKPLKDARQFFLSSMQDYVTTLYNTEDDSLLPLMRQISEAVLKHYPNHVESLSNVALTFLIIGDYEKALPYLLKAERIAPKDVIVLNNIAEAYKRKGDKQMAKAYYEKIIRVGSEEDAQDARNNIRAL